MNKYELRKSLEWLCDCFKRHPHYLENMLKECAIEVDIKYDGYYIITEEVNSLDDVVQCILKYNKENIMRKFTKEQAIVISAYTGIMACKFGDLQEDVEKRLGRPVWTHEFGSGTLVDEIRDMYKADFIAMCV